MIENGLYALLTQDTTVSSLLGAADQVHFQFIPRGSKLPCVVIHRIFSEPITTLDDVADLVPARYQFDCYAGDALKSRALSGAIFNLLKNYVGDLPNSPPDTHVQACIVNNDFDMPYEEGAKDVTFRAILDITIWYANL